MPRFIFDQSDWIKGLALNDTAIGGGFTWGQALDLKSKPGVLQPSAGGSSLTETNGAMDEFVRDIVVDNDVDTAGNERAYIIAQGGDIYRVNTATSSVTAKIDLSVDFDGSDYAALYHDGGSNPMLFYTHGTDIGRYDTSGLSLLHL